MADPAKKPPENAAGKKKLSLMALVLINVSAVLSLRGLPAQAEEGYAIVFYLIVGALLFFIPSALVPQDGRQPMGTSALRVRIRHFRETVGNADAAPRRAGNHGLWQTRRGRTD